MEKVSRKILKSHEKKLPFKLDKLDKGILRELQKNCMQSTREIGSKLDTPQTTIHQRRKRLEKHGVIRGYHAEVDPDLIGKPSCAITLVRALGADKFKEKGLEYYGVPDEIAKIPNVMEVHGLTGEYDYIVKMRGKNEKNIVYNVVERIRSLQGVERTETQMLSYTAKETCNVEIN